MTYAKNKYIRQVILATAISGLGVYANAQEFTLSGGVDLSSGTPDPASVSSNGIAQQVTGVASSQYGIPSFDVTLNPSNIPDGNYQYRFGITFDDDNSNSRIEVFLPQLDIFISSDNISTVGLAGNDEIQVLARNSNSLNLSATSPFPDSNSPVVDMGNNTIRFNMSNLLAFISDNEPLIDEILNNGITIARHYTYRLVAQQTSPGGTAIAIGVNDSSFTAFPRIQSSCADAPSSQSSSVFVLNNGALASNFTQAYAVQGQYSVTGAAGSAGSAPAAFTENCSSSTPEPDEDGVAATNEAADVIDDKLANGQTPTQDELDDLVSAGDALNEDLNGTSGATVTTSELEDLGNAVKKLVITNAALATSNNGNASVTTSTNNALSTASTVLNDFSQKENLTPDEASAGLEIVKDLLTNAPGFFEGSDDNDKNLESMENLLKATFALGARANPPVEFKSEDYQGAVQALSDVGAEEQNVPACPNTLLLPITDGSGVESGTNHNIGQNGWIWFGPSTPGTPPASTVFEYSPIALVPGFLKPFFGWTTNLDFSPELLGLTISVNCYGQVTINRNNNPLLAATAPIEFETDPETFRTTVSIGEEEKYFANFFKRSLLPGFISDGMASLADGTVQLVRDNESYILGSASADYAEFVSAVESAGFEVSSRNDGAIDIQTGPNQTFSGVFAYDNVVDHAGECGAISIAEPVGAVNSPEYAFSASCATSGAVQRIVPYINESAFYNLANTFELAIGTDRNTGIISIESIGSFKPSYFTNGLTANDQALLDASATEGFAFRAADVNGDGKMDYEVINSNGVQVLYGL